MNRLQGPLPLHIVASDDAGKGESFDAHVIEAQHVAQDAARILPQKRGRLRNRIHLRGKAAGLITASPGALGGIRAMQHARLYLSNLGLIVVPEQAAVPAANKVLGADGSIADDRTRDMLEGVGAAVCNLANAIGRNAG